jgi:hypothetical protein
LREFDKAFEIDPNDLVTPYLAGIGRHDEALCSALGEIDARSNSSRNRSRQFSWAFSWIGP